MPTYIDGIGSSQAIDTAGEVVDLKGLDCSSLIGAPFNYEHKNDTPAQIVGKILDFKKIFSEKDCETDRHKYYWSKCQIPFLYVMGRLFDDKKDSSKEVAALFIDDAENPSEPNIVGFSVEGAKLPGAKEGMVITRSIARKITVTVMPANKTCIAQMIPGPKKESQDDLDSIFKGEIEFFKPDSKYLEFLNKKEEDMKKDVGSGGGAFIGSSLAMSEKLNKAASWSGPKKTNDAVHYTHPEHGTVSIHKQPSGEFHVKHQGAMAGLKGVSGSFKTPQEAGTHAKNYMQAVSDKKILAPKMHDRGSPQMVGKFTLNKALDAGSGMSAPSQLTQGAALAKEDIDKSSVPTFGRFNAKRKNAGGGGGKVAGASLSDVSASTVSSGFGQGLGGGAFGKSQKSHWLKRAEEAYKKWEKKEAFRSFMKKSMPRLALGEIDAIGQIIALRKSMDAEDKLSKMFASYYGKEEKEIPTSENECNEVRKSTDIMMASEKKSKK